MTVQQQLMAFSNKDSKYKRELKSDNQFKDTSLELQSNRSHQVPSHLQSFYRSSQFISCDALVHLSAGPKTFTKLQAVEQLPHSLSDRSHFETSQAETLSLKRSFPAFNKVHWQPTGSAQNASARNTNERSTFSVSPALRLIREITAPTEKYVSHEEKLTQYMQSLSKALPDSLCIVWQMNEKSEELEIQTASISLDNVPKRVSVSESMIGQIAVTGQPYINTNLDQVECLERTWFAG